MLFKPLAPQFYIVKLGFTWVYIFLFIAKYHLFHLKNIGENERHNHVTKIVKKNIIWGILFHYEQVRLIFFNTLVVRLRRIASAKYETNFMLVIFAYLIILHLTGFANIPLQRNNYAGYFNTFFKK